MRRSQHLTGWTLIALAALANGAARAQDPSGTPQAALPDPSGATDVPAAPPEVTTATTAAPDAPIVSPAAASESAIDQPALPPPPAPTEAELNFDIDSYAMSLSQELIQSQDEVNLRLYGFADISFSYMFNSALGPLFGESPLFSVGNFNLYMAADYNERWRSLAEVRFLFLPAATVDATLKRVSTETYDNANIGARVEWGGISIQRVWVEYSPHELLTIRLGQWLTPVGIWNVDHGTPTIIPAFRPYVISVGFFPERQSGVELYGSRLFGKVTLGYHFTVSNGRGGGSGYLDLDKNKALGGRLFATLPFVGALTIGGSVYRGSATKANVRLADGELAADIEKRHDELAFAADLLWKWQGLHLQLEGFIQNVQYVDEYRAAPEGPSLSGGLVPDHQPKGGYVLLGYRLPWLELMPFAQFEYSYMGYGSAARQGGNHVMVTYAGGLNYQPTANVTLKAEFYHLRFFEADDSETTPTSIAMVTTAWSF
jgi:hypothetical protein